MHGERLDHPPSWLQFLLLLTVRLTRIEQQRWRAGGGGNVFIFVNIVSFRSSNWSWFFEANFFWKNFHVNHYEIRFILWLTVKDLILWFFVFSFAALNVLRIRRRSFVHWYCVDYFEERKHMTLCSLVCIRWLCKRKLPICSTFHIWLTKMIFTECEDSYFLYNYVSSRNPITMLSGKR